MNFIIETLGEIVVLIVIGAVFSFIVWKLKRRKTDFGEFVARYGEMLAYAGVVFIVIIWGVIQWLI